jgi:hypothetical protein
MLILLMNIKPMDSSSLHFVDAILIFFAAPDKLNKAMESPLSLCPYYFTCCVLDERKFNFHRPRHLPPVIKSAKCGNGMATCQKM